MTKRLKILHYFQYWFIFQAIVYIADFLFSYFKNHTACWELLIIGIILLSASASSSTNNKIIRVLSKTILGVYSLLFTITSCLLILVGSPIMPFVCILIIVSITNLLYILYSILCFAYRM